MKTSFILLILVISVHANAQVLCGTSDEGGTVTLTAPPGNIFTSVQFASYGTPNGSCESFTIGSCHAANSMSICSTALVGHNSASINASNGIFGDPCGGTFKRLYIQATYSATLPLRLISFTAKRIEQNKIKLEWSSADEINTTHFVIEKSINGISFDQAGFVTATNNATHNYNFIDAILSTTSAYYYRLKIFDHDGKYIYSNIVRINISSRGVIPLIFPNPADKFITIVSNKQETATLLNNIGQLIKEFDLIGGSQTVDVAPLKPGIYFMKTEEGVIKFIKK